MATKICDACDAVVGETETKCPKCGVEFSELDETVTAVERALSVSEKRKKRLAPAPVPTPQPEPVKLTGVARLRAIGRAFKGK